jgi:serine/threonine protein kinase
VETERGHLQDYTSTLSLPIIPYEEPSSTTTADNSTTVVLAASHVGVPQLSNFIIIGKLGNGISGTVYKIQNKASSAFLALKVIPKKGFSLSELEDIVSEQTALRRMLGHPGFLQLEASFHDSENFYLATVSKRLLALQNPLRTMLL